jgi:hypothetical protein
VRRREKNVRFKVALVPPDSSVILLPIYSEVYRFMRRVIAALIFLFAVGAMHAAPPDAQPGRKAKVAATMPLLRHRTCILIVDSA